MLVTTSDMKTLESTVVGMLVSARAMRPQHVKKQVLLCQSAAVVLPELLTTVPIITIEQT
eukprot:3142871-Amphidinium_carterae.1